MLKLKLQYFGHLMRRVDSLEKTLMLGGIGSRRRRGDGGWDGWMASLTRWTWVWANSWGWWWTRRPGVLRFMGSQTVGHNWATELSELNTVFSFIAYTCSPSTSGVSLQAQEGVMSGLPQHAEMCSPHRKRPTLLCPAGSGALGHLPLFRAPVPLSTIYSLIHIFTVRPLCCPYWNEGDCCCSVTQSCLVLCDPMDCSFHFLHTRLPCPSPSPGACSNSCSLSQWCHPTISSSVAPFSCLQSFPASESFLISWFFASGS